MTWLHTWWRETPALVRNWTAAMLPTGITLFILGLIGDQNGFWENRSFLTNLASSLTALMFAVPLALIFLGRLTAAQEAAAAVRDWRRGATRGAAEFESEVVGILSCTNVQAATAAVARAQVATDTVLQALSTDRDQVPPEAITDEFCDSAVTYLDTFAKASGVVGQRWSAVKLLEVQGRALEQSWISAQDLAAIEQRLTDLSKRDNPGLRPDRLRGRLARSRSGPLPAQPTGLATLANRSRRITEELKTCAHETRLGLKMLTELLAALPQSPP